MGYATVHEYENRDVGIEPEPSRALQRGIAASHPAHKAHADSSRQSQNPHHTAATKSAKISGHYRDILFAQ